MKIDPRREEYKTVVCREASTWESVSQSSSSCGVREAYRTSFLSKEYVVNDGDSTLWI